MLDPSTETSCAGFGLDEMEIDDNPAEEHFIRAVMADEGQVQMEESQESFDALSKPTAKGKGKARAIDEPVETELQVFRLMDLPTEIRLEIYRACLTRPYKILLSKAEQPPPAPPAEKQTSDDEATALLAQDADEDTDRQAAYMTYQTLRAGQMPGTDSLRAARFAAVRNAQRTGQRSVPLTLHNALASRVVSRTRYAPQPGIITPTPPSWTLVSQNSSNQAESSQSATQPTSKSRQNRASPDDPLIINILRTSKQIYKEARDVLYSENIFDLSMKTAVPSLAALHQRSRRHIKHIELEIPTYTEILEGFSEIVRLSLRYCSGLRKFVVHTPFALPGADGNSTSNTAVYANGFDILRWLPQQCEVILTGTKNVEIEAVVSKHLTLAKSQDKVSPYTPYRPTLFCG
jgi:hypothetical protein